MKSTGNLKVEAQTFVREALQSSGQKPSERAIKKAANKIVQALKPTFASLESTQKR
jgi:hypothetical protein